jgi:hypothetical protein
MSAWNVLVNASQGLIDGTDYYTCSGMSLIQRATAFRVVKTVSTPSGCGGPSGTAAYTSYAYDALGRAIMTSNVTTGDSVLSSTDTYYDGMNPVEVCWPGSTTAMLTYVWSPADGREILRDAVAARLSTDTGLTITANTSGGVIQRLYPMTDGLGSIVAVAAPTGVVRGKDSDAEPVWVHNRCVVGDFQKDEVSSDLVRQWAGQFETRAAIGEEGVGWHDFQVENVGPREVLVQGGGAELWADGVNSEEGLLQEAKFASNPDNSPYVPGSAAGAEVTNGIEIRLDDQLEKYAAIVNDPTNPIRGLQMITNNEGTAQWLAQKMAQHGIPGYVDVIQGGGFSTTGQPL